MNSASVFQLWINAQTLIERFHSRPLRSKFIHNLEDKVQFCIVINAQRTIPIDEFNAKRFMDIILYFYHSRMKKKTLSDTKYNYTTVIASCDKKKNDKNMLLPFFFFFRLFVYPKDWKICGRKIPPYHTLWLKEISSRLMIGMQNLNLVSRILFYSFEDETFLFLSSRSSKQREVITDPLKAYTQSIVSR